MFALVEKLLISRSPTSADEHFAVTRNESKEVGDRVLLPYQSPDGDANGIPYVFKYSTFSEALPLVTGGRADDETFPGSTWERELWNRNDS
jgi:hypothetical protein